MKETDRHHAQTKQGVADEEAAIIGMTAQNRRQSPKIMPQRNRLLDHIARWFAGQREREPGERVDQARDQEEQGEAAGIIDDIEHAPDESKRR